MSELGDGNVRVSDAVRRAANHIIRTVFGDRKVRISYSEKRTRGELGPRLETAYVTTPSEANHVHNYPLTVAGWALVEGRIIAWPGERSVPCDFGKVVRIGKMEELDRLVADERLINAPPYLARAFNVKKLQADFAARKLTLGDFYQDWNKWSPVQRYSQFISIPVPVIDLSWDGIMPPDEFGVFNVDTFDDRPLLDERSHGLLSEMAGGVAAAYGSHRAS